MCRPEGQAPWANGHCLPLGHCVQSCLSQTGSPGSPAAHFLISSNCLITSKSTSKRSDYSLSWLKPRQPWLLNSKRNLCASSIFISSHGQSHSRQPNCKWQSQYVLVRGLSHLQRPKLHAEPQGEEVKQSTSRTPQPGYLNPEQTLGNCTTKAQLAATPRILSRKRWTCHLSYHTFASHEFSSTHLYISMLFNSYFHTILFSDECR